MTEPTPAATLTAIARRAARIRADAAWLAQVTARTELTAPAVPPQPAQDTPGPGAAGTETTHGSSGRETGADGLGHACGNCEGVDPGSCIANPSIAPDLAGMLGDRIAERIALHRNGPASDGRGWYRDEADHTECLALADAVMAVVEPEIAEWRWTVEYFDAQSKRRQDHADRAEAALQRALALHTDDGTGHCGTCRMTEHPCATRRALANTPKENTR
ncbi:hypothetical protein [Streptomyces sp. SBT349]|uniref:hypothetical protein n=1 Tax=Streptomyces sp. SBT349 TaxID=1580539 RepID=UPI00066E3D55|nr:hypothetical protein [Streptomyces sp. SBT349]